MKKNQTNHRRGHASRCVVTATVRHINMSDVSTTDAMTDHCGTNILTSFGPPLADECVLGPGEAGRAGLRCTASQLASSGQPANWPPVDSQPTGLRWTASQYQLKAVTSHWTKTLVQQTKKWYWRHLQLWVCCHSRYTSTCCDQLFLRRASCSSAASVAGCANM
jgi:hypothetical protein